MFIVNVLPVSNTQHLHTDTGQDLSPIVLLDIHLTSIFYGSNLY